MKVLVTGGAGFIGSHIVDALIKQGDEVVVLDNLSTGIKNNVNPKAKLIQADIKDSNLPQIFSDEKPDIVSHHAAQINVRISVNDPKLDASINILGTINILEAIKKTPSIKKIVFASTGGAIYGDASTLPTPEDYPAWPVSPYGISKLSSEHYMHYYHQIHHLPFISLRYGNVYGPRQNPHGEAGVVAIFYNHFKQNEPFTINGNGQQTRDFVFVSDVVAANLSAISSSFTGQFNIGTGQQTSVSQLTDKLIKTLPTNPKIIKGPAKEGEQLTSCLNISKAAKYLNWQPQIDLDEGLKTTAQFFLN